MRSELEKCAHILRRLSGSLVRVLYDDSTNYKTSTKQSFHVIRCVEGSFVLLCIVRVFSYGSPKSFWFFEEKVEEK